MKEIICWLKNIYENIINWDFPYEIDGGHEWVETEVHNNCKVSVMKCERCGKLHILWEEDCAIEINKNNVNKILKTANDALTKLKEQQDEEQNQKTMECFKERFGKKL